MGNVVVVPSLGEVLDDLIELMLDRLHQRHLGPIQQARADISVVEVVVVEEEVDHFVDA